MQNKLVWIDLETTGTDSKNDMILEMGIIITNDKLKIIDKRSWLICDNYLSLFNIFYLKNGIKPSMRRVYDMHIENGLIYDILDEHKQKYSTEHVEKNAVDFIKMHSATGGPMCGSSVHFDRAFIKRNMGNLHDIFSYRNIDVSSFLEVSKRLDLEIPKIPKKESSHRVIEDLTNSITLLRSYIEKWGKENWIL